MYKNNYKIEHFTPVTLTTETIEHITREYGTECLALYVNYVSVAMWQRTNQPKATDDFMAKKLKWGIKKVKKYKKILQGKYIETITTRKDNKITGWYIKVKYLVASEPREGTGLETNKSQTMSYEELLKRDNYDPTITEE